MLSPDDARLVSFLHGGFPLSDRPFAEVAAQLGCSEDAVLDRLQRLLSHGDLTRFGPLYLVSQLSGRGAGDQPVKAGSTATGAGEGARRRKAR